MAQPIPDKASGFTAQEVSGLAKAFPPEDKVRIRREVATAILAGFAASPRGQGLDQVVSSAIEWADYLLRKLEEPNG